MVSDMVLVDRDSPRRSSDYIALGYLECIGNLFSSDEMPRNRNLSPRVTLCSVILRPH